MGWIRVEDTIFDHPAFRDDGERMLFLRLISRAAWRSHRVRYRDRMIELQRGQVAITLRDMAAISGVSKGKIEKFLKRLENEAMIETEAKTGVSVITILNYNKFQSPDNPSEDSSEDTIEDTSKTPRRHLEDEERTLIHDNTSFSVCNAHAREAEQPKDFSRETQQAVDAWKGATGAVLVTPGDRMALLGAIQRNGLENILAAIEARKRSPFLSGKSGDWGGMPLKWLWNDEKLAEVLRGEHDRRIDHKGNGKRSAPGKVDDLREVIDRAKALDDWERESLRGDEPIEERRRIGIA